MAKAWHALPYTKNPRLLAKAPDFKSFEEQEHQIKQYGMAILPKAADEQALVAEALMDAIQDIQAVPLGARYEFYRYPQGLAVVTPSGWIFSVPFDIKSGVRVANPTKANPNGNPRPRLKATKAASA